MSQDQKFQQRWEFRRGDDDHDTSSSKTESSSGGKPLAKKHKLVPTLVLPENDETTHPLSHQESQLDPYMGIPFEFGNADKVQIESSDKKHAVKNRMKRRSTKRSNKRKNNHSMLEPILLDDFKTFTMSVIEDLKVARENMFACMKEEMEKLAAGGRASRPRKRKGSCVQKIGRGKTQKNVESGMKTKSCNGGSLERSMKSDRTTDSNNCYEALEKQVNHDQTAGTITSKEKEKVEKLSFSDRKPTYSSYLSEQVVSSPYLTLPSVLSQPQAENQRLNSSCDYIQPGAAEIKNGSFKRAKSLIDASTCRAENQRLDSSCNYTQPGAAETKTGLGSERAKLLIDATTRRAENHRVDSSCNYTQPGAAENKVGVNSERPNLLIDASTRRGYLPGIQQAEQFGSFPQMGSQNLSYFDQLTTQTSTTGTGFPVPLHQGLENGLHIPSQAPENSSRENKIFGLKMSGGAIRFSGGSHALSQNLVSSRIRSQMNYKTDGGLLSFGNQDTKDGNLYQN